MKNYLLLTRKNALPLAALLALGVTSFVNQASAQLLHYDLDQTSGPALDTGTGTAANGTVNGGGFTTTGVPTEFEATNVYANNGGTGVGINAGDVAKLDGLGDFTMSGWLRVDSAGIGNFAQDRVMSKRGTTGTYFDLTFFDIGSGVTGLRLDISAGSGSSQIASTAIDLSDWFFFAVSRDATSGATQFYLGDATGTAAAAAGSGTGVTGNIAANNNDFWVGNVQANTGRAPDADFSDIRIYGDALTLAQVQAVQTTAIPEPSSFALLLGSAAWLVLFVRSRKRS